jgi:hypothetical protein
MEPLTIGIFAGVGLLALYFLVPSFRNSINSVMTGTGLLLGGGGAQSGTSSNDSSGTSGTASTGYSASPSSQSSLVSSNVATNNVQVGASPSMASYGVGLAGVGPSTNFGNVGNNYTEANMVYAQSRINAPISINYVPPTAPTSRGPSTAI